MLGSMKVTMSGLELVKLSSQISLRISKVLSVKISKYMDTKCKKAIMYQFRISQSNMHESHNFRSRDCDTFY